MEKIFTLPSIVRTLVKQWKALIAIFAAAAIALFIYIGFFAMPYNKCETSFEVIFQYSEGTEVDLTLEKRDLDNISKILHGNEMLKKIEGELKELSYSKVTLNKEYGYAYSKDGVYSFWCALDNETDAERIVGVYLEFINNKVASDPIIKSNRVGEPKIWMHQEPLILEGSKNRAAITMAGYIFGIAAFAYIAYCAVVYLLRPYFNSIEEFAYNIDVDLLGMADKLKDAASKFSAVKPNENTIAGYVGVFAKTSQKAQNFAKELMLKGFKILFVDLDIPEACSTGSVNVPSVENLKALISENNQISTLKAEAVGKSVKINISNYPKVIGLLREISKDYDYTVVNFAPVAESKDYLAAVKEFDCNIIQTDIINDYSKKILEVKNDFDWVKAKISGIIIDSKINSKVFLSNAKYKDTI